MARHGWRNKERKDADEERQRLAMEGVIAGKTLAVIGAEYLGGVSASTVSRILDRAMKARAEVDTEIYRAARTIYLARLEHLWESVYPATRPGIDADGLPTPADPRAWEVAIKVLDRFGAATGAQIMPTQDTTVNVFNLPAGSQRDDAERAILDMLAESRRKMTVVEGHLAAADTSLGQLTGVTSLDDKPSPPPL